MPKVEAACRPPGLMTFWRRAKDVVALPAVVQEPDWLVEVVDVPDSANVVTVTPTPLADHRTVWLALEVELLVSTRGRWAVREACHHPFGALVIVMPTGPTTVPTSEKFLGKA